MKGEPIDKLEREERGLSWTITSKNRKSTRGFLFQSMKVRRMRERGKERKKEIEKKRRERKKEIERREEREIERKKRKREK